MRKIKLACDNNMNCLKVYRPKIYLYNTTPVSNMCRRPDQGVDDTKDKVLPEEPTTCCMSGCANCVWIEYAEQLSKLMGGRSSQARDIILAKVSDPNMRAFLITELKSLEQCKSSKDS